MWANLLETMSLGNWLAEMLVVELDYRSCSSSHL